MADRSNVEVRCRLVSRRAALSVPAVLLCPCLMRAGCFFASIHCGALLLVASLLCGKLRRFLCWIDRALQRSYLCNLVLFRSVRISKSHSRRPRRHHTVRRQKKGFADVLERLLATASPKVVCDAHKTFTNSASDCHHVDIRALHMYVCSLAPGTRCDRCVHCSNGWKYRRGGVECWTISIAA